MLSLFAIGFSCCYHESMLRQCSPLKVVAAWSSVLLAAGVACGTGLIIHDVTGTQGVALQGYRLGYQSHMASATALASPLRYHTYYVAMVDARVEQIAVIKKPMVDTEQWLRQRKPPQESLIDWPTQEVRLTVKRVVTSRESHSGSPVPPVTLLPGTHIDVINPFIDQQPPFGVGDAIRVRLRLVSPEPVFRANDARNQWWFYPLGQPEEISPPRFPFAGVELLKE
jgi:hypothetical protein